ncbi:MAG: PAS domain S-box protein, partial [Gammaproteobacteria bacterium]|nr:PAS domain S-box protein [Gammaproteobacteria bacterium]
SMHYIGMSGMRMNAMMMYDPWIFSLSLILAIILAYIALRLKIWATESTNILILFDKNFIIASIAMGIAISAMHYTAMMATHHYPAPEMSISPAIPHNSLAWLIGSVTAIIFGSLIIVIRISDRYEALQIIHENDARINSIINNASDGIISISKAGIIELFNSGAELIFGYHKNEVIGMDISVLMPPRDQENHKQYVHQSTLHEPRILNNTRELTGRRKNGDEFPIEVNISPIDFSGKSGYVGMVRDITERKNNELELIKAKELAESSSKAKMEFISNMSHELHTPLNSIIGFAQILKLEHSGPINETQKKNIDYIEDAGNKLLSIINNIIDLSSIEKYRTTLNLDSINIHNLIDECIITIKPDLNNKNINLSTNYDRCNNSFVYADYIKLKKVILNLLSNACKFNHHNGEVHIHCNLTDNNMLKVSITDNGIGISDDQIVNLFKPFNRLGMEGGNIEGAGIGLTISMQLIELMNGHIGAESTINRGSTFWFEIPIYKK